MFIKVAKTRVFSRILIICVLFLANSLFGINFQNEISPRNAERPKRKSTKYIILHTTEASDRSSLSSLKRYGEAHYMVSTGGTVYRIIDHGRVAYHAGTSMWNGQTNLDRDSIGIEVVGWHNKSIKSAQYTALKSLVSELQGMYRISDKNVLTHSMIAYGEPNKWHKYKHRGRKRCGMLFATSSVRNRLGLTDRYTYDPDIRAGRLRVGDVYLNSVLYGKQGASVVVVPVSIAELGGQYETYIITKGKSPWDVVGLNSKLSSTLYIFPDGRRRFTGDIKNWSNIPVGTKILVQKKTSISNDKQLISGTISYVFTDAISGAQIILTEREAMSSTILYMLPKGVKGGDGFTSHQLKDLKKETKILNGYSLAGIIDGRKSAFDIVSVRWNHRDTVYYCPEKGSVTCGDKVKERSILLGTYVLLKD
jgi:N-acetylmuramoyl-L-alanine amidase